MAAAIEKELDVKPELIRGGEGIFDVAVAAETSGDGAEIVFSRFESHRFPEAPEIVELLGKRLV